MVRIARDGRCWCLPIARLLKATAFVVWNTTELSLLALGLFDPKQSERVLVSAQPISLEIFVVTTLYASCCGSTFTFICHWKSYVERRDTEFGT